MAKLLLRSWFERTNIDRDVIELIKLQGLIVVARPIQTCDGCVSRSIEQFILTLVNSKFLSWRMNVSVLDRELRSSPAAYFTFNLRCIERQIVLASFDPHIVTIFSFVFLSEIL